MLRVRSTALEQRREKHYWKSGLMHHLADTYDVVFAKRFPDGSYADCSTEKLKAREAAEDLDTWWC